MANPQRAKRTRHRGCAASQYAGLLSHHRPKSATAAPAGSQGVVPRTRTTQAGAADIGVLPTRSGPARRMLVVSVMSRFASSAIPHRLVLAVFLSAALAAGMSSSGSAAGSSTNVDAVAGARLILEGSDGADLAAVPDVAGDRRSALVLGDGAVDLPGRPAAGVVYVVFDTARTGAVRVDDPGLTGFRIIGGPYYRAGTSVADAGDVNGDGRADILVSAPRHGVTCASPTSGPCGYKAPGTAFVVYGRSGPGTVDLAHLHASQGFAIKGISGGVFLPGERVLAGLGNFTGDGYGAVAVTGAGYAVGGRRYRPGAYVIYGGRHLGTVDLQDIGSRGFRVAARDPSESLLVAHAGDVNGDRRTDLLLDQPGGEASVLFGGRHHATISAARLGRHGFTISGLAQAGGGLPMTGVGDLNGDRRSDLLIVRSEIAPNGVPPAEVDVVYGSASTRTVDLARLGSRGFRVLPGPVAAGLNLQLGPVAALGDLNGDGRADLGITAITYPPGASGSELGTVSVIFGAPFTAPLSLDALGSAGYQLTAPDQPATCAPLLPSGNRLGSSLTALGDVGGAPEFAVGAPYLGSPGQGPCAGPVGEVLIEAPPAG